MILYKQAKHHAAHRAHLVQEAKKAYAAKKVAGAATGLITDPEDPKFDLEKVIESWTKDS
ncbi:hypothetical protein L198_00223 [Cryptococcus wingfieldii CBS 7118]|uniref:Uncharacterized protein n=1 Tax=Cryptococcus wingfieldii CBS 7118 TaxID=1295528 RepID=A0A1E3K6K4_9TREE|nr:hypothetical protein L198_00223 [Cryptococcus wingfieldii CBS 7118]ODO08493.1 hypothetical protein L198_00223 [Cryptococcus wingfieldii CBS 7118]